MGSNAQSRHTAMTMQVLDFAAQTFNEIHWRTAGLLAQGEGQYGQWTQLQALTHLLELVQRDACSSPLQLGKERPARITEISLRDVSLAAKRAKDKWRMMTLVTCTDPPLELTTCIHPRPQIRNRLLRQWERGRRGRPCAETLLIHTVYTAKLARRTFVSSEATTVMTNPEQAADDRFAFFSREELLEQQCLLLESELVLMGEELTASREKIATLVLMWTSIKNELRQAEAELSKARYQLQVSATAH